MTETLEHHHPRRYDREREAARTETRLVVTVVLAAALALLARNAGKVLNRDQILQELRGMDCDAFNRSVDIAVSRLRQKLKDNPRSPEFIKTVWGSGYVFIAGLTQPDKS